MTGSGLVLGFSGSRALQPWHRPKVLKELYNLGAINSLGLGDCPKGGDLIAKSWAKVKSIPFIEFKARWTELGHAAGPVRNQQIVDWVLSSPCEAKLYIGFTILELPCRGTRGALKLARDAGLETLEFEYGILEGFVPELHTDLVRAKDLEKYRDLHAKGRRFPGK